MAEADLHIGKKGKKKKKKDDFLQKIPKIFYYLFHKDGINEKCLNRQADGSIVVDDVLDLDQYSHYTEDEVHTALVAMDTYDLHLSPSNQLCVKPKEGLPVKPLEDQSLSETPDVASQVVPHKHTSRKKRKQKQNEESKVLFSPEGAIASVTVPDNSAKTCQPSVKESGSDVKLSKTMSWLLRHGASQSGFTLQDGGYLYVSEVLSLPQIRSLTEEDVERVVTNNAKKRFYMEQHPENGRLRIRANQGHSIQVSGLDLEEISSAEEYPVVVHGTYFKAWNSIQTQGLSRMNRNHIHFAAGMPGSSGVISGMRKSCEVLVFINMKLAMQDGIQFYTSANNVILSPGNAEGFLPTKYFHEVLQRSPRKQLSFTPSS